MTGPAGGAAAPAEELYRVQAGAYRERENAENLLSLLENDGFPAYIIYHDGLYKVQIALTHVSATPSPWSGKCGRRGYNTYITTY